MAKKNKRPYGSWESPITADVIITQGLGLGETLIYSHDVYWLETRPTEGGRGVVVRKTTDGQESDMIPEGFSARSAVHEYGGGVYAVNSSGFYFTNWDDQRIYSVRKAGSIRALTPPSAERKSLRYADLTAEATWLCCVRERHNPDHEPTNDLYAISTASPNETRILASGQDFYSSPRFSPDSSKICWLPWSHPNMPWDGSVLWVADFHQNGTI